MNACTETFVYAKMTTLQLLSKTVYQTYVFQNAYINPIDLDNVPFEWKGCEIKELTSYKMNNKKNN